MNYYIKFKLLSFYVIIYVFNLTNTNNYLNKKNALYDLGKWKQAIDCLDQAIKLNQEYADANASKGYDLIKLDKN
jgi:tetratricopeptide (TPR) repeat protein